MNSLKFFEMILDHIRCEQTRDSTRGILLAYSGSEQETTEWLCDVLEDGYRKVKEYGKTRINCKTYCVVPIQYGRFYAKYNEAHGHKFAIAIMDEPGKDRAGRHGNVRVHKGNKVADTEGCPLVGQLRFDSIGKNFVLLAGTSTPAYLRLYKFLEAYYNEETKNFTEDIFWRITEQFA
jgi:hypothetical protein